MNGKRLLCHPFIPYIFIKHRLYAGWWGHRGEAACKNQALVEFTES